VSGTASVLLLTLGAAAAATALLVLPGLLVARALARPAWPGRSVVEALVALPLVLPPTAVGLVLLLALAPSSPLGSVLAAMGLDVVFTMRAVVVASAVMAFPLFVRTTRAGLQDVDPRLVAVARSLGRTPVRAFVEVELPLAWRAVAAGATLAFCRALGEFGATLVVAGNIPGRTRTVALAIFSEIQAGHEGRALALSGLVAVVAFVALLGVESLSARHERRLSR
jgi:molybdate transport system permease protein